MNELEQLWRERVDWVQASGLTIAAANAELGVSAASVYRWKRLLAESRVSERHPAGPGKRTAGRRSLRDRLSRLLPFRYEAPIRKSIRGNSTFIAARISRFEVTRAAASEC
jgi:transposase